MGDPLLHPLIQMKLPTARKRIKRYREEGVLDDNLSSAENLNRLMMRQAADFKAYQERQGMRDAEIARRKQREAEELARSTQSLHRKAEKLNRTQGSNNAPN